MMSWDLIVTIAIITVAAIYLVRKFSRGKKGGACGCGTDGGCCGGENKSETSSSCDGRHP